MLRRHYDNRLVMVIAGPRIESPFSALTTCRGGKRLGSGLEARPLTGRANHFGRLGAGAGTNSALCIELG